MHRYLNALDERRLRFTFCNFPCAIHTTQPCQNNIFQTIGKRKNSIFRGILTILYIETLAKHDTYNMNKNWIDDLSHFDYLKNLESTKENMPVGFFIKIGKLFLGLP